MVRQAREVRRLIRESSVDSAASDFTFHYGGQLYECRGSELSPQQDGAQGDWQGESLGDDQSEGEEPGLRETVLGDSRGVWRLTGPASLVTSDWGSEAGSLDTWEWDEEGCWQGEEQGQPSLSPLLPDTGGELDLEAELGAIRRSRASSSASSGSDDLTIAAVDQ